MRRMVRIFTIPMRIVQDLLVLFTQVFVVLMVALTFTLVWMTSVVLALVGVFLKS